MASFHHFVVSSTNLERRVPQFQNQFGFQVFAHRVAEKCDKSEGECEAVALYINSVVIVIRGVGTSKRVAMETSDNEPHGDWISNVVLHASNDDQYIKMYKRATSHVSWSETQILSVMSTDSQSKTTSTRLLSHCEASKSHSQTDGIRLRMFDVHTPFCFVYHTIMCGSCNCARSWTLNVTDKTSMHNSFDQFSTSISCLPGFTWCPEIYNQPCRLCCGRFDSISSHVPRGISHIDHVTFACHTGTSDSILKWYETYLGFKRFRINASEDDAGFIIEGNNGMRMLAMQYWQCSEIGAKLGVDKPVQLVFAEPLPNSGRNQVQTFLSSNGGPGIQHIAFHTEDIVGVVSCLRCNHVPFITPPPEYYSLFEKVAEIEKAGEKLDLLQQNNILIDSELEEEPKEPRYLMQVFSHPLFDRDTFFLEIIQRCGATGFGSGNITALWRALDLHFTECQNGPQHTIY